MRKNFYRIDKAVATSFARNAAGFIQTPATLTRTGVLVYRQPDGKVIRELRHPDDVFDPESLATLKAVPLTNNHPKKEIDVNDVKNHIVGYISDTIEVDRESGEVKTPLLTIFDDKTIKDAESGKVELSCGYTAELEEVPGEYNGEKYDVRQRNIRYNHVSLVDEGRAGPNVRLRFDSTDAILDSLADKFLKGEGTMEKIMIGGKEYECSPELKAALEAQAVQDKSMQDAEKAKLADMEGAKVAAEQKSAEVQQKLDSAQAKLDEALESNKKLKLDSSDEKKINALAEERMKVLVVTNHVLGKEFKADGLTNLELKKKVLENKGIDVKSKSEAYIEARFDSASETINEEIKAITTFGEQTVVRHDSVSSSKDAREAMMKRSQDAWKNENK